MKTFLLLLLLLAGGMTIAAAKPGLFDDIVKTPISAEDVLERWTRRSIESFCRQPKLLLDPELSYDQCVAHVREVAPLCAEEVLPSLPPMIDDKDIAKQAGREFLRCVLP
jgi:hypothetical protein